MTIVYRENPVKENRYCTTPMKRHLFAVKDPSKRGYLPAVLSITATCEEEEREKACNAVHCST